MATKRRKHKNAPDENAEYQPAESPRAENVVPPSGEADEAIRLRRELEQLQDKFLRTKAEQQNAARRAAKECDDAIRYANARLIRDILEVLDDFDRTLEAAEGLEDVTALLEGVKLVRGKLDKFLTDHGVEPIEAEHEPFDPTRHQALMQQPTTEYAPGTVVQQIQRGYALRDRVVRPAQVVVATAPSEDVPGAAPANEPSPEGAGEEGKIGSLNDADL